MKLYLLVAAALFFLPVVSLNGGPKPLIYNENVETILATIQENYLYEVDIDRCRVQLLQGNLNGCLDKYSHFDPAPLAETRKQDRSGAYGNISGVDTRGVIQDDVSVLAQAGLRKGDKLLEVDGRSLEGLAPDEVRLLLRGEPGSQVIVKVLRDGEVFVRVLKRQEEIIRVVSYRLEGQFGYIRLTSLYSKRVDAQWRQALWDLFAVQQARGVVVDLRGNEGGLVEPTLKAVEEFAQGGELIWYSLARNPALNIVEKSEQAGFYRGLPVVVLQDKKTGSAAEIMSGALQLMGATVVGQTSFGKGILQKQFRLRDGSELWLTTARWCLKNGCLIDGIGVTPNVALDPSLTRSQALAEAFKVLERKAS
jgi:carboxyl-terminal processing protease